MATPRSCSTARRGSTSTRSAISSEADPILVLEGAAGGRASLVAHRLIASVATADAAGLALALPALLAAHPQPAAIAVLTGPGSFTGLRAAASLALGLAGGWGIPATGVAAAEALALMAGPLGQRRLWTAIAARAGHLYLVRDNATGVLAFADLPMPEAPIALAGDAAPVAAAWLAARDADVMLLPLRAPSPEAVAAVARERLAGRRAPLPPLPLYGEAPRTTDAARRKAPV